MLFIAWLWLVFLLLIPTLVSLIKRKIASLYFHRFCVLSGTFSVARSRSIQPFQRVMQMQKQKGTGTVILLSKQGQRSKQWTRLRWYTYEGCRQESGMVFHLSQVNLNQLNLLLLILSLPQILFRNLSYLIVNVNLQSVK